MCLSLITKEQAIKAGFDPVTLFTFGYFVPKQQVAGKVHVKSDTLRLVFVGAMIVRKGLDVVVRAIKTMHAQGYKIALDIYGAGDARKAHFPGLPIRYMGLLPFDQIQAAIAGYDALVLPSRHDGWGVVVNEALLQGVPAIVSDRVGAKCLIERSGAGLIFRSEDYMDLVSKLASLIETPGLLQTLRANTLAISNGILPEAAAKYFLEVIEYYFYGLGDLPVAHWCEGPARPAAATKPITFSAV
jgi:glycosyltransferase involved in cell wall biosynthesis